MRRLLLPCLLCLGALWARADEYPYLAFEQTDGTLTVLSVGNLTMSYGDGTLTVANGETTKTFTTSLLQRMYFTDEATGLNALTQDGVYGVIEVFSVDGHRLGTYASLQAALAHLQKGVYVVKSLHKTVKISLP